MAGQSRRRFRYAGALLVSINVFLLVLVCVTLTGSQQGGLRRLSENEERYRHSDSLRQLREDSKEELPDLVAVAHRVVQLEEGKAEGSKGNNDEKPKEDAEVAERAEGKKDEKPKEAEGEEGEEGAEGEEGEEEEEEVEFTPLDLTCGICLLSFITFNMTLYYLVNWPDDEMRIYVWTVISTTISIFIAIFIFASFDMVTKMLFASGNSSNAWLAVLGFGELTFWFTVMQVSVAFVSGAMDEHPFIFDDADLPIPSQKINYRIAFKSVATLLAHITGFAAINAGGCIQHMYPFDSSALARFAVPPLMFVGQLVNSRLVRMLRLKIKNGITASRHNSYTSLKGTVPEGPSMILGNGPVKDTAVDEEELIGWCLEQWDDETYESELDIAGLAISFLLVQACRFSITGVMPNNLGIEEEHFIHPRSCTYMLVGIAMAFATGSVGFVVAHFSLPAKIEPGTLMSTVKRMVLTGRISFAMAFAWCLFTASKWEIARTLPQFLPNGVVSRVLLAMEISVIVFGVILCLDKLADMESTGDVADGAIITLIGALSTLVGFAFEQSFDGAVEALSELCFKAHPVMAQLCLTVAVVVIVYPAWRRYILRTLIQLKEKYKENTTATEAEKAAIDSME